MKKLYFVIAIIFFLSVMSAGYWGLWTYGQKLVRFHVDDIMDNANENGIIFGGRAPSVTGFPKEYTLIYKGAIFHEDSGLRLQLPLLVIKSFFLEKSPISFDLQQGFTVDGAKDPWIWSVDALSFSLVPPRLPKDLTHEGIEHWHNRDGKIKVHAIHLEKDGLSLDGTMTIQIDRNLQPEILFKGRMTGAMDFMTILQKRGYIDVKQSLIALTVLTPLTKTDENTGQNYIDIEIRLQNQSVLVGPIQVVSVPAIQWPWRSLPDLPQ